MLNTTMHVSLDSAAHHHRQTTQHHPEAATSQHVFSDALNPPALGKSFGSDHLAVSTGHTALLLLFYAVAQNDIRARNVVSQAIKETQQ
jgi:hypothetical protein